ncbi:sulfatase [Ensifer soli]|uniref:sulfatase n=1 Tax=Ciceribacter sp. sgz301302 TaxID=3342379 RepID=UPI0035B88A92
MRNDASARGRGAGAALAYGIIVFAILVLPTHPAAFQPASFLRLPLEMPVLALLALLLPRGLSRIWAGLAAVLLTLLLVLKLADLGTRSAFQRPFNPYLDLRFAADGWNLLSGTLGILPAGLAVAAAVAAIAGVAFALAHALSRLGRLQARRKAPIVALFALVAAGALLVRAVPQAGVTADLAAPAYLAARVALVARSVEDMRRFEAELAAGGGPRDGHGLFDAVKGRDVVVVFIESYGRSAVEDPRYAPRTGARLNAVDGLFRQNGIASASAWAVSPTVGGLSWLAHGTFLSGLSVDSQARYDRLMRSDRPSLNRLFREAGWTSVAIMPAITLDWPEAAYYGYDRILAARDLGYRGQPFNWVTMPDQYTLSAFERLARQPARAAGKAVMAEIALISSHAPWTPVASLVDWEAVGDGTVFDAQARAGDPPAVVWADPARVRDQYIRTIDYSLEAVGSYVARFHRDAVFVILGDHQPAAIVTGPDASRAVPVHVVSADAALVGRFVDAGFAPGMTPGLETPVRPMQDLRDLVIRLFGGPAQ